MELTYFKYLFSEPPSACIFKRNMLMSPGFGTFFCWCDVEKVDILMSAVKYT